MKRTILLLLTVFLAAFVWYGAPRLKPKQAVEETRVAKVELRDINLEIQLTGDITPNVQVEIKAEVSGKVKRIGSKVGQKVSKGEVIAEIDDADLQTERDSVWTEIEGAELRVEKSRRNFERARELFKASLVTEEVFDNLEADYRISQNELAKSQRRLQTVEEKISKTKIRAPTGGTILAVNVIEGQVVVGAASVNSGTTLMMLADLASLRIDSHVNQAEIGAVQIGEKLHFRCPSVGGMTFGAVVTFIAPVASVKNGVKGFKIQAMVEEPTPNLRPGLTVMMRVPVSLVDDCVSVPLSAVFQDFGEQTSVVYVRKGDFTEVRKVQVGVSDLVFAQIKTGLEVGEEILLVKPKS